VNISLTGRRAFVSGAAQGIGAAVATALISAGATVLAADIDAAAVSHHAAAIGAKSIQLDVTDLASVQEAFRANGPFDVVVNNAGVDQHSFFTDMTQDEWRKLIAVNLESVLICTHTSLPAMQAARFGRIVNVASEAGRLGSRGGAVYAAAKAGVIGFTKSIARENGRYGITANVVAPGPIDTPLLQHAATLGGDRALSTMLNFTQLGRLGRAEEVAAAIVFLASNEASYITGETLGVSGGMGMG
jgi:NAD(P)-dependent dehydrogenase (short-subunit alcohol dehydrogenase family)